MSSWLECVACIIVYDSGHRIFLGKRPKGSMEGGKWGIIGGMGAFKESQDRFDFAWRELQYDLGNRIDYGRLEYFDTVLFGDRKFLRVEEVYSYKADELIRLSGRERAPVECRFFSIKEIKKLNEKGMIAFDNFELIMKFVDNKQKTGW